MKPSTNQLLPRAAGILCHLTSLPAPYGIGDLGPGAVRFLDFLETAGQRYWQILPLAPGSLVFGGSPYMGLSALAGNPLLISPDLLRDNGLLDDNDLAWAREEVAGPLSEYLVDYQRVAVCKRRLLERAFARWRERPGSRDEADDFLSRHPWVDDYALFMSIRQWQQERPWNRWPRELAARETAAIEACRHRLRERLRYYLFEQLIFHRQWRDLRQQAAARGVGLIGDLPIYVSYDSVDVWAHQDCFDLDPVTLAPRHVAGVPPDYFSATGQRWGNPLYRWRRGRSANPALLAWWRRRFAAMAAQVDVLRIDHFRAFESYWQIPAEEETAVNGRWRKGPGRPFFQKMAPQLKKLPIIAEDLGLITPAVERLRDDLGLPGMKILQFAFDSDADNLYLPHNFQHPNCVVYTGTHDNNTTVGWYLSAEVGEESKARARRYGNSSGEAIHWDFIRLALSSIAMLAIIPLQDVLGFGEDCRMNVPGTAVGNWRWRCAARFLENGLARHLAAETSFYGRS